MELTTREKRVIAKRLISKNKVEFDSLLSELVRFQSFQSSIKGYVDIELNKIEQRELTSKEWVIFLSMPIRILQWVVESFTSIINKRYCQLSTEQETVDEMWRTLKNGNKVDVLMFLFGFTEDELKEYFSGQISIIYQKYNLQSMES